MYLSMRRNTTATGYAPIGIDEILAVGVAHGFAILANKLGVITHDSKGTIQLHRGIYKLRTSMTSAARKAIEKFLHVDLDVFIGEMDLCSSLSIWNATLHDYIDMLRKVKVPQMGSRLCYNNEWCFRALAVATLRMHGVSRVYYGSTDLITELPGPDEGNHRKALAESVGGPDATVEQL